MTGSGELLWVVGPLLGVVLGSLSAVDRVFLLRLVPPERRGEDFGLYALVGKLSTGFGPLVLWGGTILVAHELAGLSKFDASRVAVVVLAGAALVGPADPAAAVGRAAVRRAPTRSGALAALARRDAGIPALRGQAPLCRGRRAKHHRAMSDETAVRAAATGMVLLTLAAGQFVMTLDSSVMNVSIATVAKDLDTTVTGIQTAITLYTLVMASLMITGGKIGADPRPQAGVHDRLRASTRAGR